MWQQPERHENSRQRKKDGCCLRERRQVFENNRFEVYLDDVECLSGKIVRDYLVVAPKVRTGNLVTGVAVLPVMEGKIGLLRIYRHAIQTSGWEVPRGFVEPGESEEGSALRELEEETGLRCDDGGLESLGYLAPEPGVLAARVHLFVARRCSITRPFPADELGHIEFRLFDPNEIDQLVVSGNIEHPATQVALLHWLRRG